MRRDHKESRKGKETSQSEYVDKTYKKKGIEDPRVEVSMGGSDSKESSASNSRKSDQASPKQWHKKDKPDSSAGSAGAGPCTRPDAGRVEDALPVFPHGRPDL